MGGGTNIPPASTKIPVMFAMLRLPACAALLAATMLGLATSSWGAIPALPMRDGMPTLAPIVETVTPSVVNI